MDLENQKILGIRGESQKSRGCLLQTLIDTGEGLG